MNSYIIITKDGIAHEAKATSHYIKDGFLILLNESIDQTALFSTQNILSVHIDIKKLEDQND